MNSTLINKLEIARDVQHAIRDVLQLPGGIEAITPYKCTGLVTGHKIADNGMAFEALHRFAPEPYRSTLAAEALTLYQKTHLLNVELRKQYVLDKHDKIVATRGARS